MRMIKLEIDGPPIPAPRPRVTRNGTYIPKRKEREFALWQLRSQFHSEPWSCPVSIRLQFVFAPNKSDSRIVKSQKINGSLHHSKKPDLDNLIKQANDYLIGSILKDDAQVCTIIAEKVFGLTPKTIILIKDVSVLAREMEV